MMSLSDLRTAIANKAAKCDTRNRKSVDSYNLQIDIQHKSFGNGPAILGGLQFNVKEGEFVSVVAPSGAGKTTLLRLIAGLDVDFDGQIHASGTQISGPGVDRGMVFQESRLLPWLTAEANVAFALPENVNPKERESRTRHVLDIVRLWPFRKLLPYQLSGGMERRVALARALVNLPRILLLDEPLSSLDLPIRYALQNEIAAIHIREKLTTILVTHDVDEAIFLSNRVLVLSGSPAHISHEICVTYPQQRDRMDTLYLAERKKLLDALMQGHFIRSRNLEIC
jgi:sulfonate transport system ATP-binding protein